MLKRGTWCLECGRREGGGGVWDEEAGWREELGMRHVGAAVKDGFTLELSNRVYRAPSGAYIGLYL